MLAHATYLTKIVLKIGKIFLCLRYYIQYIQYVRLSEIVTHSDLLLFIIPGWAPKILILEVRGLI